MLLFSKFTDFLQFVQASYILNIPFTATATLFKQNPSNIHCCGTTTAQIKISALDWCFFFFFLPLLLESSTMLATVGRISAIILIFNFKQTLFNLIIFTTILHDRRCFLSLQRAPAILLLIMPATRKSALCDFLDDVSAGPANSFLLKHCQHQTETSS